MISLTSQQAKQNRAATANLVRGRYYRFSPAVEATGIPTGGAGVCAQSELNKVLRFERGWYIGYINETHVFQGRPVNDPRTIAVPAGHENAPNLDDLVCQLRECYFHVDFIGGESQAVEDTDQSN